MEVTVSKKTAVIVVFVLAIAAVAFGFWYQFMPARLTNETIREALSATERLEKEPTANPQEEEKEEVPTPGPNEEVKYFRELSEPPTDPAGGIPEKFLVRYHCSNGDFVAAFYRDWAPHGVARLYELVKEGVHNEARFYRVLPGFAVQWGIPAKPSQIAKWKEAFIEDDPPNNQSNVRGKITFAQSGPKTRTMQLFVNLGDNSKSLDSSGFVPIGEVIHGISTLDSMNAEYAEEPIKKLKEIMTMGNLFLEQQFPNMDFIKKASFVVESDASDPQAKPVIAKKETVKAGVFGDAVASADSQDADKEILYFRERTEPPTDAKGNPPDVFMVRFKTSKGDFVASFTKRWAPHGHERMYQLVRDKVFNGAKFFRVVPNFVVQFGIPAKPDIGADYREAPIKDDPVIESNTRGTISFAAAGPNTRTMQIFINYGNNSRLDGMGFSPIGKVNYGMEVVDALNSQYGEQPARYQREIMMQGNEFLDERFPGLDYIKEAVFVDLSTPKDPEAKPLVFKSSVALEVLTPKEKEAKEQAEKDAESQKQTESTNNQEPQNQQQGSETTP